ncbi:MAG: VCBS repeat-containing protein [Candidatus Marinimicrobia bacterium]|nr:VCBS repeat-containing protein [Candidatus Neomarinimicrobiota bacterium]
MDLVTADAGSDSLSILLYDGIGIFTRTAVGVGLSPHAVTSGDWDGDGLPDFAVADSGSDQVSILMNDGAGVFTRTATPTVGSGPRSIGFGDWDGDGDLDLAVANSISATVSILTNDGSGTFIVSATLAVGASPASVVAGDFDGDGDLDLAVANFADNSISNLKNDGSGGFALTSSQAVGDGPLQVIAGDWDGDGDLDLSTANTGSNNVSILRNREASIAISDDTLSFGLVKTGSQASLSFSIFNDGGPDTLEISSLMTSLPEFTADPSSGALFSGDTLVVTVTFSPSGVISYTDTLSIFSNDPNEPTVQITLQGIGAPAVVATTPRSEETRAIAATSIGISFSADMDISTFADSTFFVWGSISGIHAGGVFTHGPRTVEFQPTTGFALGEDVRVSLTQGIRSANGTPLVGGYHFQFSVHSLFGEANFLSDSTYAVGPTPAVAATGDLDGDGLSDLVVVVSGTGVIQVLENAAPSGFVLRAPLVVGIGLENALLGDVHNDGLMDILSINNSNNSVVVWKNLGGFSFTPNDTILTGIGPGGGALGDLNNDGYLDLVTADEGARSISIFLNSGTGSFGSSDTILLISGVPSSIRMRDLNRDGHLDLVISVATVSNNVVRFLNQGGGLFGPAAIYTAGSNPVDLVVLDFNSDGWPDLATANEGSNNISLLTNDGAGDFSGTVGDIAVVATPNALLGSDLNADGYPDLVVVAANNSLYTYLNDGLGTYTAGDVVDLGFLPTDVTALDINAVGAVDLAVTNATGGTVALFANQLTDSTTINITLSNPGEQHDSVAVTFEITDLRDSSVNLWVEYSIGDSINWQGAAIVGDTTGLDTSQYRGSLIWLSFDNVVDQETSAWLRITPFMGPQAGIADSVAFTLDNYQNHTVEVLLDTAMEEYSGEVLLNVRLTDATNDLLTIKGIYWVGPDSFVASLVGETSNLSPGPEFHSIRWNSRIGADSVDIISRISIFATDGWDSSAVDSTIDFHLDNNDIPRGGPQGVLIPFDTEQMGNIALVLDLVDRESDTLSLELRYSTNSGGTWGVPNFTEDSTGIVSAGYQDTLWWRSDSNLAGEDILDVWVRLIPADQDTGLGDTIVFHVDNNQLPYVDTLIVDSGEHRGNITIRYTLVDLENDSVDLITQFRKTSDTDTVWQDATVDSATTGITTYQDSLIWLSDSNLVSFAGFVEFRITPVDNDTGFAGIVTILVDQIGVPSIDSLSVADTEFTGDIIVSFSLDDDEQDTLDLVAEYSRDGGVNWDTCFTCENMNALPPTQYIDSFTWHTSLDTNLWSHDFANVRLRVRPWDGQNFGAPMVLDSIHIDNNELPLIVLTPLDGIQTDSVSIVYQLADAEFDTLSLSIFEYRLGSADSLAWLPATIAGGPRSGIDSSQYDSSFVWLSFVDTIGYHGQVQFRAIPADNDIGTADTITFQLDNLLTVVFLESDSLVGEQTDSVRIYYTIINPAGNPVDLLVESRNDTSSGWQLDVPTDPPKLTGIDSSNYQDYFVWLSREDFPGFEGTAARIRVTPSDNGVAGLLDSTIEFRLDNNLPPTFKSVGPYDPDPVTMRMTIPFTLDDAESDTLMVKGQFYADNEWHDYTPLDSLGIILPGQYTNALIWDVFSDLGFQRLFGTGRFRLMSYDLDPGDTALIDTITILNYLGDYTGDLLINTDDYALFSAKWNEDPQDTKFEIGPASGEVPYLDLLPNRVIGVIDFEDLMVFALMWDYSFANNGFPTSPPSLAKFTPDKPLVRLVRRVPQDLWRWDGLIQVDLFVSKPKDLMMVDGFLSYSRDALPLMAIDDGGYLRQFYTDSPLFTEIHPDSNQALFALAGLGIIERANVKNLPVATFSFRLERDQPELLTLDYALRGLDGIPFEAGQVRIEIENLVPKEFALHQNYPNPFNPTTTIRFELPKATKVYLAVYDLLGREAIILRQEHLDSGYHQVLWDGRDRAGRALASGLYFARLVTPEYTKSIKMLLLK